jgi:antitoxin PrlF
MATSTITSRGQTTIPRDIRKKMHLQEGDRIEWVERNDGHIEIIAITRDAEDVAGMFSDWVKKPVSIDDMNKRAKQLAAAKFRQGLE